MAEPRVMYRILLYYCFAPVEEPERLQIEQLNLCIGLGIRGRIIVASEGINGTISGTPEATKAYMQALHADPRFAGTDFKIEDSDVHQFEKINVRVKKEIVHAGIPEIKPYEQTGTHLTPAEFKAMKDGEDVVVLDVRSNHEHRLGKFKNAITLDIENFRDFPDKLEDIQNLKNKKVITYCTGGIKCEKASAFLLENGFDNVYQLLGGIIRYGIEEGGEDFEGKCYVFDKRVAIDVNTVNPTMVSNCHVCGSHTDRMVNCANPDCNLHATICLECSENLEGACSKECADHPKKRPFATDGYYGKKPIGYIPGLGYKMKV